MSRLLARLAGFVSLPLLAAITPLLLMPVVARLCNSAQWAAIAVGQSVGSVALSFVAYGWGIVGPARVAMTHDAQHRIRIYTESLWVRLAVFVVGLVVGGAICAVTSRSLDVGLALITYVGVTLSAFTMNWYGVGVGSPWLIARYNVIPQLLSCGATVVVVLLTRNVYLYPVVLAAGPLLGVVLFSRSLHGSWRLPWVGVARVGELLRRDLTPAAVNSVVSVYSLAPVPIQAHLSDVQETARFASADKLYRYGMFAVGALGDGLQSWVVGEHQRARDRQLAAIVAHAVLGVLGGVFLIVAGPMATSLLFGERLSAGRGVLVGYAIAYAAVSISTPFVRNILIPAERSGAVLRANLAGLATGVVALPLLRSHGPGSVAMALAAVELVVTTLVIVQALRLVRRRGTWSVPADGADHATARVAGAVADPDTAE